MAQISQSMAAHYVSPALAAHTQMEGRRDRMTQTKIVSSKCRRRDA